MPGLSLGVVVGSADGAAGGAIKLAGVGIALGGAGGGTAETARSAPSVRQGDVHGSNPIECRDQL